VTFLDGVKNKVGRLVGTAQNQHRARAEKAESDITPDAAVAGSRADDDGKDGDYVGRTSPQYDAEELQSGAEARSEARRQSPTAP
jgi:hypothetical protein